MNLQPIDYHSVISIGRSLLEQASRSLEEQESRLAKEILVAIHIPLHDIPLLAPPDLAHPAVAGYQMHLSEALDSFEKRIELGARRGKKTGLQKPLAREWEEALRRINRALKDHLDLLHESISELFLQVSQLGYLEWKPELLQVVDSFKKIFRQRLDALHHSIKRLEHLLRHYSHAFAAHPNWLELLARRFGLRRSLLDKELLGKLNNSLKLLHENFHHFKARYNGYVALMEKSSPSLHKLDWFPVLHGMEGEAQDLYKKMVQLLKMRELRTNDKLLSDQDFVWNLRSLASLDHAKTFFRQYLHKIEDALFRTSRVIKLGIQEGYRTPHEMHDDIDSFRRELATFRTTLEGYHQLLLGGRSDLSKVAESAKNLEALFTRMNQEMQESLSRTPRERKEMMDQLNETINQMAQPLISRDRMRAIANRYITLMEQCHELGTTDLAVFDLIGESLSKGMRADWKYQVLQERKEFHRLYEKHCRIWGLNGDRAHIKRKNYFLDHFKQIESLLKNQQKPHHDHDLTQEMNEIKASLQDFLGYLQRLEGEMAVGSQRSSRLLNQAQYELLKYRSIFSVFFLHLQRYSVEGVLLRRQFLFVDQYFDTMEAKIHLLKNLLGGSEAGKIR